MSSTDAFLDILPIDIRLQFPAILTHKSGMDIKLIDFMKSCFMEGMGPQSFKNTLLEKHALKHGNYQVQYYQCIERLYKIKQSKNAPFQTLNSQTLSLSPMFSDFYDKKGYNGFVPSGNLNGLF